MEAYIDYDAYTKSMPENESKMDFPEGEALFS